MPTLDKVTTYPLEQMYVCEHVFESGMIIARDLCFEKYADCRFYDKTILKLRQR